MTIEGLKKLLDRGDYVKIARIAGYTDLKMGRMYVYSVLSGRRNSQKGIGKKILDAAHIIAARNAENGKSTATEL